MKNFTKVFAIAIAMFGFANSSFAQTGATIGGSVTAINEIDDFTPVTTLTLDSDGVLATVASITVSNNYENAWDLKLAFTNDGVFTRNAADGDASSATIEGGVIPISAFSLVENGTPGTLGNDLTAPTGAFTLTTDAAGDYYTFDTGSTQATATVAYKMDILCSWSATTADLQGTYEEIITATLTVGDGI